MQKKIIAKNVRLSKNIIPLRYDIQLRPDLENFTFGGIETITLSVLKKAKLLTLHCKEIDIETVSIKEVPIPKLKKSGTETPTYSVGISYNTKQETVDFVFPKYIPAGKIKLTIVFKGILNDKMRGFYRSKYHIDGKEHHMATTQFEATDARRAFPCFDEPAHKAVFHISLVVPKNKTAISNTLPVSVREHEAGYDVIKFLPTPKMSTYLLAFIVGDFEYIEKKSNRGVVVRVYTIPGKKHQASFALDATVQVLEFYEKYFNIPYPLKTLDMIAIPDFSSLAMENWGAVTFREVGLLVDEKNTSTGSRQMIAEVIAHELAHQWFGNLVTMEWWTHLWLNEGFASYISYLAVDKLFPKWDIWTQFSTNTLGIALRLDSLLETHPIEVEVHHPSEIGEIFDEISYSKGASVIRMIADYLGEKDFRDGLRLYLKKHSYKNTETLHLWEAFEKVSKKPVAKIMSNWTGKPGYPVIKASVNNSQLSLSQERFFASPISKNKVTDKTLWQIPIKYSPKVQFLRNIAQRDGASIAIFQQKNMRVEQKLAPRKNLDKKVVSSEAWTKINFGEAGFYRTAYSHELLQKLVKPVADKTLSPRDRLGIVRDLFALSEAGTIPTTDALEFLKSYKKPASTRGDSSTQGGEDNYSVWLELAVGLARIEQLLAKTAIKNSLDIFSRNLFSPLAKRLGWNAKKNETHADTLLRSLAISRAGRAGDKKIIAEARKKFSQIKNGKHISPDIRGAIYGIVAAHGGRKEYNQLVKMYKKETLHEEKNRIGNALGDFPDRKLLKLTCEFAMSKDVRTQDTVSILSGVGTNPHGRDIWWSFLQKNWKILVSRYGEGGLTLGRAVKAIGGSAEEKHLNSITKFFKTHEAPGAKRAINQVIERLEGNVAWLKRDKKIIEKFLKKNLKL